jgi:HSP20 family protein
MAEKNTGMTPARREPRRQGLSRPSAWGASPFQAFQRLADEMDRMFDDFGLGRRWASPLWSGAGAGTMWAPDVEVFQKNSQLTIRADLPGMKRDEISVDVNEDSVTIQGERRREREEDQEGLYRSERSYGSFCRVIPLPQGAISDQAKATFRDGVLEITMPAPPHSRGRRIEIGEGNK